VEQDLGFIRSGRIVVEIEGDMAAVKWRRISDVASGVAIGHGRESMRLFGLRWRVSRTLPALPSSSCGSSVMVPSGSIRVHNFVCSLSSSVRGAEIGPGLEHGRGEIRGLNVHDRGEGKRARGLPKGLQAHAICASCNAPLSASVASIYPFCDPGMRCSRCGAVDSLVVVGFGTNSMRAAGEGPKGSDAGQLI